MLSRYSPSISAKKIRVSQLIYLIIIILEIISPDIFQKILGLPKGTKTASDTDISLESLADQPFIMQRESCDADARRMIDKLNLDVRTVCHVVDDKTTVEMVKAGFGFAIMR